MCHLFHHDLDLPNQSVEPARLYGVQHFVRHIADQSPWQPAAETGAEEQDMGLGAATDGLVTARRVRAEAGTGVRIDLGHGGDFRLVFVTDGSATLTSPDGTTWTSTTR